ncbi:MAG TPA: LON peptidase substrate-binding domain-containing protein [Xanthomonadales bacterium]|nr:LON peptidase substrate-binding domain-containing protein [Xanthomonadales bacterium]
MSEIPIFPLRTVLFPGGQLPLRIFERRYLDMVSECSRSGTGFGVCYLVDSTETRPDDSSARVGTLAQIVDWYTLEDGLLGLTAEGTTRFVLGEDRTDESGLMMGEVSWLPEPPATDLPVAYDVLSQVLARFMEKAADHYPDYTPEHLQDASWVGYRLSELLPLGGVEKQQLLELSDPIDRLQKLVEFLPRFQT